MKSFIARHNVLLYQKLLETERDGAQRQRLEQLLAEALAELDGLGPTLFDPPPYNRPPPIARR